MHLMVEYQILRSWTYLQVAIELSFDRMKGTGIASHSSQARILEQ